MARRRGRPGDHLATSDYSGCTTYASELIRDFWGDFGTVQEVLQRNLQEISTPLNDPYPVRIYRGPQYEATNQCDFELQPLFIGNTNIPFPNTYITTLFDLNPAIPDMSIGCTFRVAPDGTGVSGEILTESGDALLTEDGTPLVMEGF